MTYINKDKIEWKDQLKEKPLSKWEEADLMDYVKKEKVAQAVEMLKKEIKDKCYLSNHNREEAVFRVIDEIFGDLQ